MVGTAHQESTITEGGKTVKISTDITVTTSNGGGNKVLANAGPDFTANIPEGQTQISVILDGSKSTGNITKVFWSKLAGPADVVIVNDSILKTTFLVNQEGVYRFLLAVGDDVGNASTDEVKVTITKGVVSPPPPPSDKDPGLPPKPWLEQPEKGGNKDPNLWKVVPMLKDPKLSKVIDDKGINIAVEFTTAAYAKQYIDHFVWIKNNPPIDHHCASNQHWDEAQQKCIDNPPGGSAFDKFGLRKIYEDDPAKSSEDWFMSDLSNDPRVDLSGTVKNLGGGVFEGHVTPADHPASFRINVRNSNPKAFDINEQKKIGLDWKKKMQLGYSITETPKEFRNFEMTIAWKAQWAQDDEMSLYGRGMHHSDGWPIACLATEYKGQIQRAGNSRFAKEMHHQSGSNGYVFQKGNPQFQLSPRENVWTYQKFVCYDDGNNITLEVYADKSGNDDPSKLDWQLMNSIVDSGQFGDCENKDYVAQCNGVSQQKFLWASPCVVFRIDNVIVQVKYASVRNIIPTKVS